MASPWSLYEDLPPPPTAALAQAVPATAQPTTTTAKPDLSEWTSNPKFAKLMLTTNRKKGTTTIPRTTQVTTLKPKKAALDKPLIQHTNEVKAVTAVSSTLNSDPLPMEVEEEYDPARPNEYDKYVSDRAQKAKLEKEEDMKKDRDLEWDKESEDVIPKPAAIELNVSGEEAFNRRARLSGRAPSPPHNVPQVQAGDIDDDLDGEALDTTPSAPPPMQSHSAPKESIAARMMAKMGWKEGSGLGREEQGMTTALVHKKTDRGTNVIVNAPPVTQAKPRSAGRSNPSFPEQSKILLLKNMVGPGEVDDELEAETASECSKYGEVVVSFFSLLPKINILVGGVVDPSEAVRIYIQFTRQEAAVKAFVDLNGRFFGGRTVSASFFNEERFNANDLAPSKEELEAMGMEVMDQ